MCLGYWVFGRTACQIWLTLDVLYCTASIWNLCVIAFDRFTATMYPVWYSVPLSARSGTVRAGFGSDSSTCFLELPCETDGPMLVQHTSIGPTGFVSCQ